MKSHAAAHIIMTALIVAVLAALPGATALAQDIYNEKGDTVIENVTESDIPRLVQLLGDEDPTVRWKAGTFLVSFGGTGVPDLLKALKDGENRAEVINILATLKDPRSVEPIAEYIDDDDDGVRDAASSALRRMGGSSVPLLVGMLERNEKPFTVADILAGIGGTEAQHKLIRPMLKSPDPAKRAAAARILGDWGDRESAGEIETLLNDPEPVVRESATKAYPKVVDEYNQPLLAGLLKDSSDKVRIGAAELLGRVRKPDVAVVEPLLDAANNDPNKDVRKLAIYALGVTGDPRALVTLLKALEDPDLEIQGHALGGLEAMRAKEAVPYIIKPFEEKRPLDENIVLNSCIALIAIGEPVDVRLFYPYLLEAKNHDTKVNIMNLIAKYVPENGKAEAARIVEKMMAADKENTVRNLAVQLLKKLKDE